MSLPAETIEHLRRGISAAQADDRERAARLLREVTEKAPELVDAWSWLAFATDDALERVGSMQRVAELDPDNQAVREWLRRNGFPVRSSEPRDADASISELWEGDGDSRDASVETSDSVAGRWEPDELAPEPASEASFAGLRLDDDDPPQGGFAALPGFGAAPEKQSGGTPGAPTLGSALDLIGSDEVERDAADREGQAVSFALDEDLEDLEDLEDDEAGPVDVQPLPRTASSPDFRSIMAELAGDPELYDDSVGGAASPPREATPLDALDALAASEQPTQVVSVPAADPTPPPAAQAQPSPDRRGGAAAPEATRPHAPRVLIVHTDPTTSNLLRLGFEQAGCTVRRCSTEGDALQQATSETPDLVFSGPSTSEGDALELCRTLKTTPQTAGVAFVMHAPGAGMLKKLKARSVGVDELIDEELSVEIITGVFQRRLSQ